MTTPDVHTELERLRLLAVVSDLVTTTPDTTEALRDLARLFVPALADWAVVDVLAGEDTVIRQAVIHRDPTQAPPGRFEHPLPLLPPASEPSASSLVRALRDGELVVVDTFEDPDTADCPIHRAQLELFRTLGASHAVVVPLVSREVPVGAFTLVRTDPAAPFGGGELALIEGIARRTALAVDNARLYAQQIDAAAAFQRSLLPSLPQPEHLRLTARYVPAGEGRAIGGDWYDAFVGADGQTTVVIGDVVGHDVHASARMAELRNLLRGCSWNAPPSPAVVLERLDDAVRGLDLPSIATVVCGRFERQDGSYRFRWANAGHLPPMVVPPSGPARLLTGDSGVIIGVGGGHPYVDNEVTIGPGTRLVLFTDGLIEHRGDLRDGLAHLTSVASNLQGTSLDALCDGLVEQLAEPCDDDIAVLAVEVVDGDPAT